MQKTNYHPPISDLISPDRLQPTMNMHQFLRNVVIKSQHQTRSNGQGYYRYREVIADYSNEPRSIPIIRTKDDKNELE